jgi:tetratricopeptide (TPR) repeat protein
VSETARSPITWLAGVALLAALLAGQAVADANTPVGYAPDSGRTIGRAGFSYLTGLRTFAAYSIWNRLDPQFHEYYRGNTLGEQKFLLPNMQLVLMLDPQFIQGYYDAPWILADMGRVDESLAVAKQGADNNPRSGLLRIAYAQIIAIKRGDWSAAAVEADKARLPSILWDDDNQKWENYRVMEDIYTRSGQTDKASEVAAVLDELARKYGSADKIGGRSTESHDHNGDGKPDH